MLKAKSVQRILRTTDASVARLLELVLAEYARQHATIRRLEIICGACNKPSPLHLWTFIQDRYYVPPSGCTGGDFWMDTEAACCHIRCPACLHRNYIYNRPDRDILVELLTRKRIDREKLFDPKIIVESERQASY